MEFNNIVPPNEDLIDSYWVSDGLEPCFQKWARQNPVLISAQTGHGKNHFIMKKLIPFAVSTGQQVFLLSNRVALGIQQKKELLDALGFPNIYSDEELRKMENFGLVHVWSYQSVLKHINEISALVQQEPIPMHYLVLDEAHFFLSDAPFNAYTELIFWQLLYAAQYCKRIYMTATPENILPLINEYEQSKYIMENRQRVLLWEVSQVVRSTNSENTRQDNFQIEFPVHVYTFKRDYSRYDVTFFTDWKHLYARLQHASATNKWLCFVNSEERQSKIKSELKNLQPNLQIDCFDASKKQEGNKAWEKILDGKIPGFILLSTSVIDNGVNMTDPDLHNIVLEATDKVAFLQMLGRKRLKDNEVINVFVRVPTEAELKKQILDIEKYLQNLRSYYNSSHDFFQTTWPSFTPELQRLFWISNEPNGIHFVPNNFAYRELAIRHHFFSSLLFDMQHADKPKDVYPLKVFEWLEFPDCRKTISWITDEAERAAIRELVELLNSNSDCGISKEDQNNFYERFMSIVQAIAYQRPTQRDDKRSSLATIIRHLDCLLDKLPMKYELKKDGNSWRVEKLEKC